MELPEDAALFDLPSLEALIDDPATLELDPLADWLLHEPPAACGKASGGGGGESPDDVTAQLTSSDGSHSTDAHKPLPDLEKQQRIRAQNRVKQNRYRQKQKERREQLEATYEATAADLERERQLNDSMRRVAAVQEALREQKDAAVEVLEAAAGAQPAGPQPKQAGGTADPDIKTLADQLWRLSFSERSQILNRAFHSTPCGQAGLALSAGNDSEESACISPELSKQLAVEVAARHPKLLEAALTATPEQLRKDRDGVQELAVEILGEYDAGRVDAEEAQRRFTVGTAPYTLLIAMLMIHKPEVALDIMSSTRLPGESEAEEAARWRRIALESDVSKEQLQVWAPHYAAHQARMQQLGSETASTLQALREVQQRLAEQCQVQGLSSAAQQYIDVFDAASALTHHSEAAMFLSLDFKNTIGTSLKPLQKMRMVALSRPLYPDVAAMVREALRHHGMLPGAGPGNEASQRLLAPAREETAAA